MSETGGLSSPGGKPFLHTGGLQPPLLAMHGSRLRETPCLSIKGPYPAEPGIPLKRLLAERESLTCHVDGPESRAGTRPLSFPDILP